MFNVIGQRSRSQRNLSAAKRYNTAMDGFGDSNLAYGVVVKAWKSWRGIGRPQVAMHSQLPRFLVRSFTVPNSVFPPARQTTENRLLRENYNFKILPVA